MKSCENADAQERVPPGDLRSYMDYPRTVGGPRIVAAVRECGRDKGYDFVKIIEMKAMFL